VALDWQLTPAKFDEIEFASSPWKAN